MTFIVAADMLSAYRRVGLELANFTHPCSRPWTRYSPSLPCTPPSWTPLSIAVSEHPDDDKFLATAIASGATLLVPGDKHLLRVSGWIDLVVLKPRDSGNTLTNGAY